MDHSTDKWELKDAWLGLLFLFVGALALLASILTKGNGYGLQLWLPGFLVGPLFLFLGGNAVFRSLRGR